MRSPYYNNRRKKGHEKILTLLLALWMLTGCVAMAAENQLVVGSTTAMSGAFFTDLFGSNTADMDVRALLHGYNLMSWDNETGTYQINDSVVAGMAVSRTRRITACTRSTSTAI